MYGWRQLAVKELMWTSVRGTIVCSVSSRGLETVRDSAPSASMAALLASSQRQGLNANSKHWFTACFHDIWKSAQVPKCLIIIVKSLIIKIVHTVTKGKRHSAGCTCEGKKSYKDVWMREWEEYCNDGWMFLNKRPTMMCLAKKKKKKRKKDMLPWRKVPESEFRSVGLNPNSEHWFTTSSNHCHKWLRHKSPKTVSQQLFLFPIFVS